MPSPPDSPTPKHPPRRRLLRRAGWLLLVFVILVGVGLLFLPQIATGVIAQLTDDLDLQQFEVEVVEVGWNEATLTDLAAADGNWQAHASTIVVRYAPWDLLRGKVQSLILEDLRLDLAPKASSENRPPLNPPKGDGATAGDPDHRGATSFAWLHTLSEALSKCPRITAPHTQLTVSRDATPIRMSFDLDLRREGSGVLHLTIDEEAQSLSATLNPIPTGSSLAIQLALPDPGSWLTITESLLGAERPWLPTTLTPGPLEANALLSISDKIESIELSGAVTDFRYALENESISARSSRTSFEGTIRPAGSSQIALRGDFADCELRFKTIPGGALTLAEAPPPEWTASLSWGEDPFSYSGTLEQIALRGGVKGRPLELTRGTATFSNRDALFRTGGGLQLNGLALPFAFVQQAPSPDASPNAQLTLGPVTLDGPHPLLAALLPSGEAPDLSGTFEAAIALRLPSEKAASGTLDLTATDASSRLADGLISLGPLSGKARLQIPINDSPPEFHFEGTLQALTLDTTDSLGFPLAHAAASPALLQIHGTFATDAPHILATIRGLSLAGERNGQAVDFADTTLDLDWRETTMTAKASSHLGTVPLAIDYSHERKELPDGGWHLRGHLALAPTTIVDSLTTLGAFSGFLDGTSLRGTLDSRFDFETGSNRGLEGDLRFGIADGSIDLPDPLTKITGLAGRGSVKLPSADDTPVSWEAEGTLRSLMMDSSAALGFPLTHTGEFLESPATFALSGTTGEKPTTTGKITHLSLAGEQHGESVTFQESSLQFLHSDDTLTAEGRTTFGENEIPFTYRRNNKELPDGKSTVTSEVHIPTIRLGTPLTNLGAFSKAAAGLSLSGQVGARVTFQSGPDDALPTTLDFSLADGTLTLPDDGPTLSGITVHFLTPDVKTLHTDQAEPFSIADLTYGDLSFTKITGHYQIRPDRGLTVSRFQSSFLDGRLNVDPFTYPDDDQADFRMNLRFVGIDLRTLTRLFPSFDGRLEGTIDGDLPIVRKKGTYLPERGGIQLSKQGAARLRYNADSLFTDGLKPGSGEYKRMKIAEDSLKDMRIPILTGRLFDPAEPGKAAVIRIEGQSSNIADAPPIHLNFNFFEPKGEFRQLLDYFFKNREKLNFGL